jgi:proteasome activator subunit 4
MSVAFAGRSLCLTSLSTRGKQEDCGGGDDAYVDLLTISLSNALLGMDANDPPKTLATMQLIGSIFSNVRADALIIFSILSFMPIINEHVHFPFNL